MAQKTTMRAIVQDRYGEADVLQLREDVPLPPPPGKGEVLVKVHAAGFHKGDWHMIAGNPYVMRLAFGITRPQKGRVVGSDIAGVVEAVGPEVVRFKKGDEVWGTAGLGGGWAEFACTQQDKLALKPSNTPFDQAANTATSACTAMQALTDVGKVRAGQKVLVIGASGGVGIYAVQLAKTFGAEVTAVCSSEKMEMVAGLGADKCIDYKSGPDVTDREEKYDLILDIGGSRTVDSMRKILTETGTLALVGGEGGNSFLPMGRQFYMLLLSPWVKQSLKSFVSFPTPEQLQFLQGEMEAGRLRSVISDTFPLEKAPDAMRQHTAGRVKGKVAIKIV